MISVIAGRLVTALTKEIGVDSTRYADDLCPNIKPLHLLPTDPAFTIGVSEEPETPVEDTQNITSPYPDVNKYRSKILVRVRHVDLAQGQLLRNKVVRRIKAGLRRVSNGVDYTMRDDLIFSDTTDNITEHVLKYDIVRVEYVYGKGEASWDIIGIIWLEFECEMSL